ncbi:unnamed protein product [Phytomonas sp. Hart1]|eukprot:CCW67981.1 unnamed protein product [Phytomonas sp. isolate Hart1]
MSVADQEGVESLIPCNNECGGNYEKYRFGQTDKEVEVFVPLDNETTSKHLKVSIAPNNLHVNVKGVTILSGKLFKPIKATESTWLIRDRELVVVLVKTNLKYEEWWPLVVEGEVQINMKTLKPPEVHMAELDEGARATIGRLMFDQQQKRAGKVTSEEFMLTE